MSLQIKEILKIAEARLQTAGCPNPRIDAEELMCHMLEFDRGRFFMNLGDVLSENSCENYFKLVDLRATRKPLQHITGFQEFMGVPFKVNEHVLVPRQDTETLVEAALEHLKSAKAAGGVLKILDVGTGSGAIAVSICVKNDGVKAVASDISPDALKLAKRNAAAADVSNRIKFLKSDMFGSFRSGFGGDSFHAILSNPPYIKRRLIPLLQKEVSEHEPKIALDGGFDGLDFYRIFAGEAAKYLKKRGLLMLEIGHDQAEQVTELFEATDRYEDLRVIKDLGGNDRVFSATLKDKHTKK